MPLDLRTATRGLVAIQAALARRVSHQQAITLPQGRWQRLCRLQIHYQLACQRGWSAAAAHLQIQWQQQLGWFETDLQVLQRRLPTAVVPSLRTLYDELQGLEQEFEQVTLDLAATTLTVTTDAIVLEDLDFGPFALRWNWERLPTDDALTVVALEPLRPDGRDDLTHPHVLDDRLCVGDGWLGLEAALATGRLSDYFVILRQVLRTYNFDSAYQALTHWFAVTCHDCGTQVTSDDRRSCAQCSTDLCDSCAADCPDCNEPHCHRCQRTCDDCEAAWCRACWPRTTGIAPEHCPRCVVAANSALDLEDERDDET
ncbi:hypothetical protein GC163_20660 [bacterium]|nr:hypothetical protein [bacterium]